MDALLKDPAKLPAHLQYHDRRASRVDVDVSDIFICRLCVALLTHVPFRPSTPIPPSRPRFSHCTSNKTIHNFAKTLTSVMVLPIG
jgi:hypothetical protein